MKEIDGICYADSMEPILRVDSVKPLPRRMMLIIFSNEEERLLDTTMLDGPVFDVLDDEEVFSSPSVEHGFISWDNGKVDVATETAYALSMLFNRKDLVSAS